MWYWTGLRCPQLHHYLGEVMIVLRYLVAIIGLIILIPIFVIGYVTGMILSPFQVAFNDGSDQTKYYLKKVVRFIRGK